MRVRAGRRRNKVRSRKIDRALKRHFEKLSSPDRLQGIMSSDSSDDDDSDGDDSDDSDEKSDEQDLIDDVKDDDDYAEVKVRH